MTRCRTHIRVSIAIIIAIASGVASAQAQTWGQDGWYYQAQGGQWVRTAYSRVFPNRNNPNIYDVYQSGRFSSRFDVSHPGWIRELPAANNVPTSAISWFLYPANAAPTEANVRVFLKASNRWVSAAELRAAAANAQRAQAPYTGNPAGIIGGGVSTPNQNPLTVDSVAADRARANMSPALQQQAGEIDLYLAQSRSRGSWATPN